MTKVLPASIEAMIEALPGDSLTLARCAVVILRDGTEIGFTDHDATLDVTMEQVEYGHILCKPGQGLVVGEIDLALGLQADSTELGVPFGDLVRLRHLVGRRLNHATVYLFDVDWSEEVMEPLELMKGQINDAKAEGPIARAEVRSQADYWNQVVGQLMAPRCDVLVFGDARCTVQREPVGTTVLEVESTQRFRIDLAGLFPDQHFRFGTMAFTSGELADVWPEDIFAYSPDGWVELVASLPDAPEVGDQLWIKVGCSRLKVHDDPTIPTCASYDNVPNFRGFDRVPGSDVYFRMPIPGQGNS